MSRRRSPCRSRATMWWWICESHRYSGTMRSIEQLQLLSPRRLRCISQRLRLALCDLRQPISENGQFWRIGAGLRRDQIEARVDRQCDLEWHDQTALGDVVLHIGGAAHGDAESV